MLRTQHNTTRPRTMNIWMMLGPSIQTRVHSRVLEIIRSFNSIANERDLHIQKSNRCSAFLKLVFEARSTCLFQMSIEFMRMGAQTKDIVPIAPHLSYLTSRPNNQSRYFNTGQRSRIRDFTSMHKTHSRTFRHHPQREGLGIGGPRWAYVLAM